MVVLIHELQRGSRPAGRTQIAGPGGQRSPDVVLRVVKDHADFVRHGERSPPFGATSRSTWVRQRNQALRWVSGGVLGERVALAERVVSLNQNRV